MIDLGLQFLQPVDRRDGRVAGGQHRVDHDHVALVQVAGHLEVVLDGDQRLGVAVQADVADARAGHHGQHAVEDAGAGAQDRDEHQLLAVDDLAGRAFQRRLDLDVVHRHVAQ